MWWKMTETDFHHPEKTSEKIYLNDTSETGSLKSQVYLLVSPIYLKPSGKRAQRSSLFLITLILKIQWGERTGELAVIFTSLEGLLLIPFGWVDELKLQVGGKLGDFQITANLGHKKSPGMAVDVSSSLLLYRGKLLYRKNTWQGIVYGL